MRPLYYIIIIHKYNIIIHNNYVARADDERVCVIVQYFLYRKHDLVPKSKTKFRYEKNVYQCKIRYVVISSMI